MLTQLTEEQKVCICRHVVKFFALLVNNMVHCYWPLWPMFISEFSSACNPFPLLQKLVYNKVAYTDMKEMNVT